MTVAMSSTRFDEKQFFSHAIFFMTKKLVFGPMGGGVFDIDLSIFLIFGRHPLPILPRIVPTSVSKNNIAFPRQPLPGPP